MRVDFFTSVFLSDSTKLVILKKRIFLRVDRIAMGSLTTRIEIIIILKILI